MFYQQISNPGPAQDVNMLCERCVHKRISTWGQWHVEHSFKKKIFGKVVFTTFCWRDQKLIHICSSDQPMVWNCSRQHVSSERTSSCHWKWWYWSKPSAPFVTSSGSVKSISRYTMRTQSGALSRAASKEPVDMLVLAALNGEHDHLSGCSSAIICGIMP